MNNNKITKWVALLLIAFPYYLEAQSSILFVGNSYTYFNEMPKMVGMLAKVNNTELTITSSVDGGVSLKEHWEEYRGLRSKTLIADGDFEFLVLQDQSLTPIQKPNLTLKYGELLARLAEGKGSKVIIYQTWSRKNNPGSQEKLDDTFGKLAQSTGAKIANVADAWHLAFEEYPELQLYDPDGSHPSALGSYLAALIIYRTLLEVTTPGDYNTFVSENLPPAEMKKCEWIADQIMKR